MRATEKRGKMERLLDRVLAWLQGRCSHPDHMVSADVTEGGAGDLQVKWCRRCGAVRVTWYMGCTTPQRWRRPDPMLFIG